MNEVLPVETIDEEPMRAQSFEHRWSRMTPQFRVLAALEHLSRVKQSSAKACLCLEVTADSSLPTTVYVETCHSCRDLLKQAPDDVHEKLEGIKIHSKCLPIESSEAAESSETVAA